jgi:hypothetical protein
MTSGWLALVLMLAVWPATAQLPPSGTLSDHDLQSFRDAVARIETLLPSAPDKATLTYEMARTWAAAKQWPETIEWLRKVADWNAGLDPSRDAIFADLRGTREFDRILAAVHQATPEVSHSSVAFMVNEGDLVPENLAYDSKRKQFYFGSTTKGKVIRCSGSGSCAQFATGLGTVLGMKVRGDALWLVSNSPNQAALVHYQLPSARLVRKYSVSGNHEFNDLAFAPAGDVYVSDTRAGAIWHLAKGAADLTQLPERVDFANGITLSPGGSLLYVSTFPNGIAVIDLKAGQATPIAHPPNLCLATIDGLYFHRGALIAIQNAFMTPRVVRFMLSRDLRAIERFEVLERRNPLFDGVTTGVIAGSNFFYMANIQDSKKTGFDPIAILKLHL